MKSRAKLDKTFDRIQKILTDEMGIEGTSIKSTSSFIDDLNMDADDLAEFFTAVEDSFSQPGKKIEIPDHESDNLVTIQDLIDYLQEQGIED